MYTTEYEVRIPGDSKTLALKSYLFNHKYEGCGQKKRVDLTSARRVTSDIYTA